MISILLVRNALRRGHDDPLSIDTEQIWTFPHESERLRGLNRIQVLPVQSILGGEHENFTDILSGACTEHHVIRAVLFPHLRIPHMTAEIWRVILIFQNTTIAVCRDAITRNRQADIVSASLIDIIIIAGMLDIAGVVQIQKEASDENRNDRDPSLSVHLLLPLP